MIHGSSPKRVIRREVNRRARNDDHLRRCWEIHRAVRSNMDAERSFVLTGRVYVWCPPLSRYVRLEEMEA